MSKPNLLGFSSSVGIYRNKRMRDLREILEKEIPVKVAFAELATTLFQVVMAYAAENQIDGDFSGYRPRDFVEIFTSNHFPVSLTQAEKIRKAFDSVGLFEGGKIRSWAKFNRHFADHEKIQKIKRRAGKLSRQKWEREVLGAGPIQSKNSGNTDSEHVQKPSQKDSPSKQLWILDQALLQARGKARKELLSQREQLLSAHTGVDLSSPAPSPAPPPPPAPKKSAKQRDQEWELACLKAGKEAIDNGSPEILTESMVRALLKHGYKLPAQVEAKFRKLLKETDNPVPE